MKTRLGIIIVNWNGYDDTAECLDGLSKQTWTDFTIYLVDNGSSGPDLKKLSNEFASVFKKRWVPIALAENTGFTGGNNAVLTKHAADHDWFLLLNNDTLPHAAFLEQSMNQAESLDTRVGSFGPVVLNVDGSVQSTGMRIIGGQAVVLNSIKGPVPYPVDAVSGCSLFLRANAIQKIGPLYEPYFLYYEETDWQMISHQHGLSTYLLPQSSVVHKGSVSSNRISGFQEYYMMRNRLIFIRRVFAKQPFARWFYLAVSLLVYVPFRTIRLILQRSPKTVGSLLKGAADGWAYRPTSS